MEAAEVSAKFYDAWAANYDKNYLSEVKSLGVDLAGLTWQQKDYLDLCLDETASSLFEVYEAGEEELESLISRGISCAIESYFQEYPNK